MINKGGNAKTTFKSKKSNFLPISILIIEICALFNIYVYAGIGYALAAFLGLSLAYLIAKR